MADAQKSKSRSREWVERLPASSQSNEYEYEVTRLTGKEPTKSTEIGLMCQLMGQSMVDPVGLG